MNSLHFRNLFEALSTTLISVIKEKIGEHKIENKDNDKYLLLENPINTNIREQVKVVTLCSECLILSNETSLKWEEIKNFENLLKCLEYIEYWKKKKSDEFISIKWGIMDFECRASEIENATFEPSLKFDRSKFPFALKVLENRHDCNFGITWHDVDDILYEFCKIGQS
jgi:hypothetical protein